jgi:aryl-alcohol dehydrogenase-like predicted oxidoreductase
MKNLPLGNSDLSITPLGIGSWAIGGDWKFGWGPQSDTDSIAAIHLALDLGTNWIDTAPTYGLGHSETVIGRAIKSLGSRKPYIFTKCGMVWDDGGVLSRSLKRDSVIRECDESLKRLGVDAIDLYQIHWPSTDPDELLECWGAMQELKRKGKIRWAGVCNLQVAELIKLHDVAPVTSLQAAYSLINKSAEAELIPWCNGHGVGFLAYSPLGSGLLTGRRTRERLEKLPESDWRRRNTEFREPKLSANLKIADALVTEALKNGLHPAKLAIDTIRRHETVSGVIVGIRNPTQAEAILKTTTR